MTLISDDVISERLLILQDKKFIRKETLKNSLNFHL